MHYKVFMSIKSRICFLHQRIRIIYEFDVFKNQVIYLKNKSEKMVNDSHEKYDFFVYNYFYFI